MEERINLKGYVRAYTTFNKPSNIIVSTDKGDVSVPVNDTSKYPLNQKVEISLSVRIDDE